MTWNSENLTRGSKELGTLELFKTNNISVAVVTKAEVPASLSFDVDGYVAFLLLVDPLEKFRVIVYVRQDVAT
jgi:hypothetical protein